jgi:hypothetical protein
MRGGTELNVRGLCTSAAVVLGGAAAVLILVILIGDSKDVAAKSFSFALFFALFTLPAAVGVYLVRERSGLLLWIGVLTTVAAIVAFVAVIAAAWQGNIFEGGGDWKTAGVWTLISIGSGQGSLILALGRSDDIPLVNALRWAGLIPIAVLTIIGAEDISNHGPAASWKIYSVFAVLYVLGIVLPPLVERATRIEDEPPATESGTGYY